MSEPLTKEELDAKREAWKSRKITRYFTKHKYRTAFMFCCLVILIVCISLDIPITGDMPEEKPEEKTEEKPEEKTEEKPKEKTEENEKISKDGKKALAFFGFISSSVFMALLFTILGVETYLSREELEEINRGQQDQIKVNVEKKKNDYNFIENYVKPLLSKFYKRSTIHSGGSNENNENTKIIKDFYKILPQLSDEELEKIYEDIINYNSSQ